MIITGEYDKCVHQRSTSTRSRYLTVSHRREHSDHQLHSYIDIYTSPAEGENSYLNSGTRKFGPTIMRCSFRRNRWRSNAAPYASFIADHTSGCTFKCRVRSRWRLFPRWHHLVSWIDGTLGTNDWRFKSVCSFHYRTIPESMIRKSPLVVPKESHQDR